ncbi:MAG: 1-phosphofructokinase family hexose kinase [Propioniciclava sp.]
MIVTVTPAPSIDWTLAVADFSFGAVNRASGSTREPSGKGVNVAFALHRAGVATTTVFPAGGSTGEFMVDALVNRGVPTVVIPTQRDVRTNVSLVTAQHPGTKINESGTALDPETVAALLEAVADLAERADTVVSCGSLPAGVPETFHRDVASLAAAHGCDAVVDTSGAPLAAALAAQPALIKPNHEELAELAGQRIDTLGDAIGAARSACDRGAQAVLASLGAQGVLYCGPEAVIHAYAVGTPVVNSVGAGDALLAGFIGGGPDLEDRVRTAVLWATSAVAYPTTLFPIRPEFAHAITLTAEPDRAMPLTEPHLVHP